MGVYQERWVRYPDKLDMQNPMSPTPTIEAPVASVIKLGIDVHASSYTVVKKVDSSAPERAKKMPSEKFLRWMRSLKKSSSEVYTCYEAGPFGYSLHRQLEAMGVTNFVIRPINWDTHGKNVKTDARDAHQMALCLDGYLRGNDRSFSTVRVPTEKEEQQRSLVRQRQSLISDRGRAAKRGLSHGLYYGQKIPSGWWKPRKWAQLKEDMDAFILSLLEPLRETCLHFSQQIAELEERLEALEPERELPKGMGTVLYEQMEREVCSWDRFKSRKAVGSFTGLCPSEDTSADRRFQGSINKHGNRRLRHMLIECAWLLIRWNGSYKGVQKWKKQLDSPKTAKGRRKQIVVAIARQFAVDWWRIRTGQCSAQDLDLVLKSAPC